MQNARKWELALLLAAGAFLLAGFFALTFCPAPRFSDRENRFLADAPSLSLEGLVSGEYTAAWESYATERMPGRAPMRALCACLRLGMGYGEVRGVIPCPHSVLLRRPKVSEGAYRQNLKRLSALTVTCEQETGRAPTVVVLPRSIDVGEALLPADFDRKELETVWETLDQALPDAILPQACALPQYWYRTDHHWTSDGAYAAYLSLCERLGYTPLSDFERTEVSNSFYGSSACAAGIPFLSPDSIHLYRFAGDSDFRVRKNGVSPDFVGFYDESALAARDQYSLFFGGNCACLEIDRGEGDERPLLFVIKDSFANSLLPFLSRHFRIVAFDPRYAPTQAQLREAMRSADRHLVLCGMQSLCEAAFF